MARWWTTVVVTALAAVGFSRGEESTTEAQTNTQTEAQKDTQDVDSPRFLVQLIEGKGFNISIPSNYTLKGLFHYSQHPSQHILS